MRDRHSWNPQLVIPKTFEQCLTYEKQIMFLWRKIEELQQEIDELKANLTPQSK